MPSTGCGACRAATAASCGSPPSMPTITSSISRMHRKPSRFLGADGNVLPAVREVLKICAEQKLVVHPGRLSPSEALGVIAAGRDAGLDRLVVTHAQFEVVNMSFDEMKKAASMGA